MRTRFIAAAIAATLALPLGITAARADDVPTIGEVDQFAFNFCPSGWHATNGGLLNVKRNVALALVLGTRYGGDGVKTFGLPKLVGKLSTNRARLTSCLALVGIYPTLPAVLPR